MRSEPDPLLRSKTVFQKKRKRNPTNNAKSYYNKTFVYIPPGIYTCVQKQCKNKKKNGIRLIRRMPCWAILQSRTPPRQSQILTNTWLATQTVLPLVAIRVTARVNHCAGTRKCRSLIRVGVQPGMHRLIPQTSERTNRQHRE